ncbi:hypothetical protein YC2023_060869 [Brassica napus]
MHILEYKISDMTSQQSLVQRPSQVSNRQMFHLWPNQQTPINSTYIYKLNPDMPMCKVKDKYLQANSLINKTKSQLEVCQELETTQIKVTPKRQQQKFQLSFLSGMATVESESLKWCPRGASTVKTEEEEG